LWGGGGETRGDSAGRPSVALAGQRALGRSGQGAREARARLRAVRRRPERLCQVEEGGRARVRGAEEAVRKATARGQRGKERGGLGGETGLSRLRLLGGRRETDQAPGGSQGPWGDEGASPGDHEPQ